MRQRITCQKYDEQKWYQSEWIVSSYSRMMRHKFCFEFWKKQNLWCTFQSQRPLVKIENKNLRQRCEQFLWCNVHKKQFLSSILFNVEKLQTRCSLYSHPFRNISRYVTCTIMLIKVHAKQRNSSKRVYFKWLSDYAFVTITKIPWFLLLR